MRLITEELIFQKDGGFFSNKYEYNTYSEFDNHSYQMLDEGYKITSESFCKYGCTIVYTKNMDLKTKCNTDKCGFFGNSCIGISSGYSCENRLTPKQCNKKMKKLGLTDIKKLWTINKLKGVN